MNDALGWPQSVLVLGGGSDIARATVRALVAGRCRRVVLAGRGADRPGGLQDAAAEARSAGATRVETLEWDAVDVGGHADAIERVFAAGTMDLVLMAVGVLGVQSDLEHDPAGTAALLTTNFTGVAAACLVVADQLRAQGHGTLVVLSSVAGERVRPANFVYGSSKAGLDGFALGLAESLSGSGARVMVVRPGFVKTRMTTGLRPAPLAVTADDVAEAIVRGLEKGRRLIWVPPSLRPVMAVLRHLPSPVFRLIDR